MRVAKAAFVFALGALANACSPSAAPTERDSTTRESEVAETHEHLDSISPATNPTFWLEKSRFAATDGDLEDRFGESVAVSGDTVIVGNLRDDDLGSSSGSAYVFVRSGDSFVQQQKLLPNDGAASDIFGQNLALAGDTALVASNDDDFGTNSGAVYVFVRSGTTWTQHQKLVASDAEASDNFGFGVSIYGNTAILGAPGNDDQGNLAGCAYVFEWTGTAWTERQKLVAADGSANLQFGGEVSLHADTAVIGATNNGGAAYVFVKSGTTWVQQQKLATVPPPVGLGYFGSSISLSAETVLVSSHGDSLGGGANRGSAYVFVRSGTTWTQQQKLVASTGSAGDYFGFSLALSGDSALIGAFEANSGTGIIDSGAVFAFVRSGSVWSERQKLVPSDAQNSDRFGSAVGISGTNAVIGAATAAAPPSGMGTGVAYFYSSDPLPDGSLCPDGAIVCSSGICKDGVCCGTPCAGACQRCNATPGTCTPVTSADDVSECTGANTCDATGACKKKTSQACTAGNECATGNCSNGYCCNQPCTGGCDVCNATPGTCTLISSGSPGEGAACSSYVCTGSSAACPSPCTSDTGCIGTHYCSASGTCEPRKSPASACNDTVGEDCLQGGCRVCQGTGNGNCIDGYCCDSACTAPCDVCSAAIGQGPNGTCDTADEGYAPAACGAYACNGTVSTCSTTCAKDEHCAPTHYCAAGGTCQLRRAQGEACNDTGGQDCLVGDCRVCNTAGGCADGFCCNAPCSGACDVCSQALGAFQNGLCGVAPAGSPGSPSCMPYLCNGSAPSCASSCSSDNGCIQSAWCDASDSRCKPDQPNGESCTAGSQCISGNCVDGFCCNDPCQGTCQACAALLKESGTGNGICGNAESGSDPRDDCTAEAPSTCGDDGSCDGVGRCRKHQRGIGCGTGNTCVGNQTTGRICDGNGACDPNPSGVDCAPYVCPMGGSGCAIPCAANTQCVADYFCDAGTCRFKRSDGQACVLEGECLSGFCTEGFCCDTRCDGLCQSCRAAEKASGDEDGNCGPAAEGSDPHDDCGADDPASCDKDGSCDGSGQCRLYEGGTECRETACTGDDENGFEVTAYECDGAGACDSTRQSVCGFYGCSSASCGSDCDDDSDCTLDAYCDGGECKSKTGLGTGCTLASECQSGFCVDGFCCDGLCAGQCEACDLAGGEGRCTPVTGAPRGDRPTCAEAPADEPCAQTECDGETRDECAGFVGQEVICRAASCEDGTAVPEARCRSGVCPESQDNPCEPYVCDGDVCGVGPCESTEECSPGNLCADGRCVSGATCSADGLELIDDTGASIACSPYRCEGARCRESCEASADCAPGFACNPGRSECEKVAPPAADEDSGCGCRVNGRSRGGFSYAWLVGVALLLRRRRPSVGD